MLTVREHVKSVLPKSLRLVLRSALHYAQRIGRWLVILWQVRGVTWRDEWTLIRSALTSPVTSFNDLMAWQDPVLLGDALVEVRGVGRFLLRKRCDDLWHVLPWRERAVLGELGNRLRSGDIFLDAGANIGVYTIFAARLVAPDGRVIALEMMPDTANVLRRHIELNQLTNVTVVEKALSDEAGHEVRAQVPDGKYGQASIVERKVRGGRDVTVTTTTLEELLEGIQRVAVVKMDLEGAEELALMGAGDALKRIDAIIFEDWGVGQLSALLKSRGFQVDRLDGNNSLAVNTGRS